MTLSTQTFSHPLARPLSNLPSYPSQPLNMSSGADENDIEIGVISNPMVSDVGYDLTESNKKEKNFKDKSSESFETFVNRSAEGTADAAARRRGVSEADAFQTSSAAAGGFLQGSGSLLEMLTIAINFLQTFSLVTLLKVNWRSWFKNLFRWMQIFMLDFEFVGDTECWNRTTACSGWVVSRGMTTKL